MLSKLLKHKNARLLLISIILGLVAALLIRSYISQTIFRETGGKVVPIVVAKTEIPAGTVIRAEQLAITTIPEAYLHARSVHARDQSFLIGQRPSVDLVQGEAIQWPEIQLAPDQTLQDRVGVDQRAITIRVDQTASLSGMIQPGNRVDIVCQVRSGKTGGIMHMVAQNMTIIAVGDRLTANSESASTKKGDSEENNVSTVTFRASPEEAMLLGYAESQGRIILLLRNDRDVIESPAKDVGASDLLGAPVAQNAPTPGTGDTTGAGEYPTIYEPGQQPRNGNLPNNRDFEQELKQLTPEDAQKRLQQQLQGATPAPK
jgi:pilus assembly protein CpaB